MRSTALFRQAALAVSIGPMSPPREPRDEPFGYICRRCLNCCRHKQIQLNPYEVARLARNRGVSTGELAARFTQNGAGQILSQTGDDGACVFLGPEGCTVHPDRPLVCRLYPLGRYVDHEGAESFRRLTPHPRSAGEVTADGTIGAFLDEQGAAPFIAAADAYLAWLRAAIAAVPGAAAAIGPRRVDPAAEGQPAGDLLDMDAAVTEHCLSTGEPEPADVQSRLEMHLRILHRHLAGGSEHE